MYVPTRRLYRTVFLAALALYAPPSSADTTPTSPPHGGDPVLQAEHDAVMALVSDDQVTHRIVASGDWDDDSIWLNQQRPTDPGANVAINSGVEVWLATVETLPLHTLRIDGSLRFDPTVDTALFVDTIVLTSGGALEIGGDGAPIEAARTATITFTDSGPIDRVWDPYGFSRALISHGAIHIHGEEVTPFLAVTSAAGAGTQTLTLEAPPIGWHVGDRVALTGTQPTIANDTEEFTISSLAGSVVTLSQKLVYSHAVPEPGLYPYLSNLTRNVRFVSQNPAIDRRGHVMFMHSDHVELEGAGFYSLGRTNKSVPINDAVVTNGVLQAGTGTNPRGRYSVHIHRAGTSNPNAPVVIADNVVDDNPGWGYVNHSSNVLFEDNIAYKVFGSGYATEAGNELGTFHHNLALKSTGKAGQLEARKSVQDFGYEGWGFWFQGAGGLHIVDNVAAGSVMAGFMVYASGLIQSGTTTTFPSQYLADASWANGATSVNVAYAPIPECTGNEVFDSPQGFESIYLLLNAPHTQRSFVEYLTVWGLVNYGTAVYLPYTNQLTLRSSDLIGDLAKPVTAGIGGTNATNNMVLEDVRMVGFSQGVWFPMIGENRIIGGEYRNVVNFRIPTYGSPNRLIDFSGDLQASVLTLPNKVPYDIATNGSLTVNTYYFPNLFEPDRILLNEGPYAGSQVYFAEQASSFIPFPVGQAQSFVPSELLNKTNQQIWTEYGLTIYGAMTPGDAVTVPTIKGAVGSVSSYQPKLQMLSPQQVGTSANYQLIYRDAQGNKVTDPQLTTLKSGWNVITRLIGGQTRSFFVYNSATTTTPPPTSAGVLEFEVTSVSVAESVGSVTLKVRRINGSTGQVSVSWATRAETALAGSDFTQASGTLTFLSGELEKTVTVSILNDSVHEGLEQLHFELSNPVGTTLTDSKRLAYVAITDDDP